MGPIPCLLACALLAQDPLPPEAASAGYAQLFAEAHVALAEDRLDLARERLEACFELEPSSANCAYARARVEARSGASEAALVWLERAVRELGYGDEAMLTWEPDFEGLRGSQEFAALERAAAARPAPVTGDARLAWAEDLGSVGVHPDGSRLVTGRGGDALLWDVRSGDPLAVIPGPVLGAAFAPDGEHLVVLSRDRGRLHDARSGAFLRDLEGRAPGQAPPSFDHGGELCYLNDGVSSPGIWRVATGERLELDLPRTAFGALSGDGLFLLTELGVWELERGAWLHASHRRIALGMGPYTGGFSHDGSLALLRSGDGQLQVWDVEENTGFRLPMRTGTVRDAVWAGARDELALLTSEERLVTWTPREATWTELGALAGEAGWGARLEVDRHGEVLLVTRRGGAEGWSRSRAERLWTREGSSIPPRGPGGAQVALLRVQGDAEVLDAGTGGHVSTLTTARGGPPVALPDSGLVSRASPDGGSILLEAASGARVESARSADGASIVQSVMSADGHWRVDLDSERALWTGPVHGSTARVVGVENTGAVGISDDGGRILSFSGGLEGTAALWDRETGCVRWERDRVRAAALSPDGTLVATAFGGRVRLLGAESGTPLGEPLSHSARVRTLTFSPDGELLATGCVDGWARVWRALDGTLLAEFHHEDYLVRAIAVNLVRFSPDSKRLLTTTGDYYRVSSWDVESGRLLWETDFGGGNPSVLDAQWSPDGRWVACSGGYCGSTTVLDGFTGGIVDRATGPCPDELAFTDDGRFLLAREGAALTCRATFTWGQRWLRVDFPGGTWLRAVPTLHCDGSAAALERAFVVRGDDSTRLSELAAELLDPRKVEAWLAGVSVEPAVIRP